MDQRSPIAPLPTDTSATHRAYAALRRMIVVGEVRPGEKLKIDTLRDRLVTGASPIREALSLLTSDQLVERIDQRGFRAAPISLQNFQEILNLRCSLEDMALRQSLETATDVWEEELVLSHHRMVREKSTQIEAFEDLHKSFHMNLLSNSGSPILLKFCSQLYDLNIRYRFLAGTSSRYQKRDVTQEHEDILKAAIERDADAASRALLNHYRKTGAFLTEKFASAFAG